MLKYLTLCNRINITKLLVISLPILFTGCAALGIASQHDLNDLNKHITEVGSAFGPTGVATSGIITALTTVGYNLYRNLTAKKRYKKYGLVSNK